MKQHGGRHLKVQDYFHSRAFVNGHASFDPSLTPIMHEVVEFFLGCGEAEERDGRTIMCTRPKGTCDNGAHGFHVGQVEHFVLYMHDAIAAVVAREEAADLSKAMGMILKFGEPV